MHKKTNILTRSKLTNVFSENPHNDEITVIAVSKEQDKRQYFATGGMDGMVKLWLVNNLEDQVEYNNQSFSGKINDIKFYSSEEFTPIERYRDP